MAPMSTPILIDTAQEDLQVTKDVPAGPAPTQPNISESVSPFDADGDGRYTYEELKKAVESLYIAYEWPEDYETTPQLLLSGFAPMAEQDARWRVPYEYTLVGGAHQCAWEFAWLDAYRVGDTALMDKSLGQLRTVAMTRPTLHPNAVEFFSEAYDQAALGDPALIQQDVENNCDASEFATPITRATSTSSAGTSRPAQ